MPFCRPNGKFPGWKCICRPDSNWLQTCQTTFLSQWHPEDTIPMPELARIFADAFFFALFFFLNFCSYLVDRILATTFHTIVSYYISVKHFFLIKWICTTWPCDTRATNKLPIYLPKVMWLFYFKNRDLYTETSWSRWSICQIFPSCTIEENRLNLKMRFCNTC